MLNHYIPKRRVPVLLWSNELRGVHGQVFLDLDPSGSRHQTVLTKLNESLRFLAVAVGDEGRIHLFNKGRLTRVSTPPHVLQSDVFARGFQPSREEDADLKLCDGASLSGRVWMPMQRPTQRVSDFMNQQGWEFFVLVAPAAIHLINSSAVVEMKLTETVDPPLALGSGEGAAAA